MTRLKRAFRWIASHKLLTLLLVILFLFLIQVATIPWFGVPRLKDRNPKETALMRQRVDEAEAKGKTLVIRQSWVPLSKLPRHLTDAIIVAEDGTFYEHEGFDWFEVRESLEKNIKERRAARGEARSRSSWPRTCTSRPRRIPCGRPGKWSLRCCWSRI